MTARAGFTILTVLLLATILVNGKVDPETGRLRVVLFGESYRLHIILEDDPKITLVWVPSGDFTDPELMARFMRIYMPRTYETFTGDYDVFILSDLVPWGFDDRQLFWLRDSISDLGMGMVLNEMGWYGIADWTGNAAWDWVETVLYEAYPCELVIGQWSKQGRIQVIKDDHPFLSLPGIENMAFASLGIQLPRDGTTVWAVYKISLEPLILSRPFGEGMAVSNAPGIERMLTSYIEWEYHPEFFAYHAYLAGEVPIPEDLILVHRVRTQLKTFRDHSSFVEGMVEFIDKFNANTRPVEEMLAKVRPLRGMAEGLYIEQRYEESADLLLEANRQFDEIGKEAVRLKDQALFWVYVIEWSAVTAASLMAGVVLWTLMVKRRLYRDVRSTRYS